MGYTCSTCGKYHDGSILDLGFDKPFYYNPEDKKSAETLTSDTFILNGEHFFIRGVLKIPIIDSDEVFVYGVWVSLSEKNFKRYMNVYGKDDELKEPVYFGWLSNKIKGYPETLSLKTHVHLKGKGLRPEIELEHTEHPLALEQRNGITMHRVNEVVGPYL